MGAPATDTPPRPRQPRPRLVLPRSNKAAPLNWGSNVAVFDPTMPASAITQVIRKLYLGSSEFTAQRVALFFLPGVYAVSFKVNYYMGVYGLGLRPGDTVINGTIQVCDSGSVGDPDHCGGGGHALDNFWRACENLTINPPGGSVTWAVSQACAMRRVVINGSLQLSEGGYSSGGFVADSVVNGPVNFGTQQQFLFRNVTCGAGSGPPRGGAWNIVFVGCRGGRPADGNTVVVPTAPLAAPKPFVCVDGAGRWQLAVPAARADAVGAPGEADPPRLISDFRVVTSDSEMAAAATCGGHLVVAPGIYNMSAPLLVGGDAVVLGVGMPTLLAGPRGALAADPELPPLGAHVGGFLLEATPTTRTYLLDWSPAESPSSAEEDVLPRPRVVDPRPPSYLYDIYTRVRATALPPSGGTMAIPAMVRIGLDGTICDNFWLWVADHGDGMPASSDCSAGSAAYWADFARRVQCPSCLVVPANDVTFYGLATEHALGGALVDWAGAGGRVYFFQSEYPYHPAADYAQAAFAGRGAGLEIEGGGAYSYFPCAAASPPGGFTLLPDARGRVFTRFLTGQGGIAMTALIGTSGSAGQNAATPCGGKIWSGAPGPAWCQR